MGKIRNTVSKMIEKTDKFTSRHDLMFKSVFAIFFILLVALQPALMKGNISNDIPDPYHDFGVYEKKDALLSNLSTMEESSEIANIANQTLDVTINDITNQIQTWDDVKDIMTFKTLPMPEIIEPGILQKAQDFGIGSITSTILDGRSYYIYANSSENPEGVWITSDSVTDPLKRPVIHAKLVTDIVEVSLLDPTPVDIDNNGMYDVEVEVLIEAEVDGDLTSILDDPLGSIPIPSLPIVPQLGDRPPNVRITNPPTNFWVIGRTLQSDSWQLAGWTWEFDFEINSPEIERVVVAIDNNSDDAEWDEANLTNVLDPLPDWPWRSWYKWYYDWDLRDVENGLHTVYVRAYEGDEFTQDSVKIYVSNPVYKGVRLKVNVDRINDAFNQTSNINILRPFSTGGTQQIWALGMSFENITQHFTAYLKPEALSLSEHLPTPGSALLESILVEYLEGPYYIGWNASSIPQGFELCFSHAEIYALTGGNLTEVTWLKLNFTDSEPSQTAEIKIALNTTLELDSNVSADVNMLEWQGDRVTNLSLEYHDERKSDTIHLTACIIGMPMTLIIELENQSSSKPYDVYTSMHFNSSSNVEGLLINEYIFEDDVLNISLGVNITDLPREFYLNGTYSALSIQPPQILNLNGSYMWPYLWDLISMYIGGIFAQVAHRVGSLPLRVFDQSLLQGEYVLSVLGDEEIKELEFYVTNEQYPQVEGNFLCIYNNSDSNLTVSSRLYGISKIAARSNETGMSLEANLSTDSELRLINLHGPDAQGFESIYLSNVPNHLLISTNYTTINYTASEKVDNLKLLCNNSGLHIFVKIIDIPRRLNFVQTKSNMMLKAFDDYITKIEFVVSDSKAMGIEGDYLMVQNERDMNMLSGRISHLKRLFYSNNETLALSASLKGGDPFRIVGRMNSHNIEEKLVLDAFIDNVPDELDLVMPNDRFNRSLGIVDITSISGIADVTDTFSSIAGIGESIVDMMVNVTELFTSELSALVGGVYISYSLAEESNMDLIARIELGDATKVKNCIWTHGISAKSGTNGSLSTKIFLTGLPQTAEIQLELVGDTSIVDFVINNFSPRYDWLLLDVQVIEDMDVLLYMDDIKGKIHKLAFQSRVEITPHSTVTFINSSVRSENGLKDVYLQGRITDPYPTKVEMFLSSVPDSLDMTLSAENDVDLKHKTSGNIEYLMLNVSRFIDKKWYEGTVIAHDIPMHLDMAFEANTKYTKDTPLLGMPRLNVNTDSDTLDLYLDMDGRIFGRRGSYEIYTENIRSGLTAGLRGTTYKIRAQNLKKFVMEVRNLPLMPTYNLKILRLYVKDLNSVDLKISLIANLYPVIQLDNTEVKDLKLALSHDIEIIGAKLSPNVVLSEATFFQSNNPKLQILFKSPTHINGISTTLGKENSVLIIPNIFATLMVTFAPLFIVFILLLLLLYIGLRIYRHRKGEEEDANEPEEESQDQDDANEQSEDSMVGINEKDKIEKKARRFTKKKIIAVIFLLIILAGLIYYFIWPWTELNVKTNFMETPSGIFVICETTNTGTVIIEDLSVELNVYNSTNVIMNSTAYTANLLNRWDYAEGFVHYFGDQYESYRIEITVFFKTNGNKYQKTLNHEAKDHMRLEFEDSIR